MILYPAIDLKDGNCVRLLRGDMDKATVFSNTPSAQAALFESQGFEWLHLVDLNGAFEGKAVNSVAVKSIIQQVSAPPLAATPTLGSASKGMNVQLGGGIRNMQMIADWIEAGISRVILGTIALKNPQMVKEACRLFPGQIAVGIDARNGLVAVSGWAEMSDKKAVDLAKQFEDSGVAAIIYTDIAKDGAMEGPNFDETITLAESISIPVIASGGISSVSDIKLFKAAELSGIEGVIIGRALYDGAITPEAALKLC